MKYKILTNNKETISDYKRFIDVWSNASNSIQQQSSGSTGSPKLIEIPKWKMEASAKMTGAFFNLERMNKSLLCISPNYIGGKMMIVRSIIFNLELHVADISSNPIKDLNEFIDFAAMVPLQVDTILNENPEKLDLIKYLIIGGAPVSLELEKRIQDRKCIAYSTYGMTETISHIALKKLDDKNTPFRSIGKTSFKENDGELIINSPELKIRDLQTNDIVELIDEKNFYWKGRKDFVINSGGIKIHPEIIEQKIKNEIKMNGFIVSSVSDVTYGEKIIIICEKNVHSELLKFIDNWSFDRYSKPKEIYAIDQLPLTKSGKIDRIAARDKITHD